MLVRESTQGFEKNNNYIEFVYFNVRNFLGLRKTNSLSLFNYSFLNYLEYCKFCFRNNVGVWVGAYLMKVNDVSISWICKMLKSVCICMYFFEYRTYVFYGILSFDSMSFVVQCDLKYGPTWYRRHLWRHLVLGFLSRTNRNRSSNS